MDARFAIYSMNDKANKINFQQQQFSKDRKVLVWNTVKLNLFCITLEIRNGLCLESVVFMASMFHAFWEAANGWIRSLSRLVVLFAMVPIQNYFYKKAFLNIVLTSQYWLLIQIGVAPPERFVRLKSKQMNSLQKKVQILSSQRIVYNLESQKSPN